jgi:hypothetical protein
MWNKMDFILSRATNVDVKVRNFCQRDKNIRRGATSSKYRRRGRNGELAIRRTEAAPEATSFYFIFRRERPLGTGLTRSKQDQRRGYQLWATSSCFSETE